MPSWGWAPPRAPCVFLFLFSPARPQPLDLRAAHLPWNQKRSALQPCLPLRGCVCHGQGLAARYVCTFPTIGLIVGVPRRLCLHNAPNLDESRRSTSRLSREASAPALKLSQAASSIPGQYGSSSAKRCEHVEVTFSD